MLSQKLARLLHYLLDIMDDLFDDSRFDYEDNHVDRFAAWSESDDIGFVWLAFAVIIESVKDLFYGEIDDHLDALNFWLDYEKIEDDTLYSRYSTVNLWLAVLGVDFMPEIVADFVYRDIEPSEQEKENYLKELEHLQSVMKTDYYYLWTTNSED